MTILTRRQLLQGFGASLVSAGFIRPATAESVNEAMFASAFQDGDRCGIVLLDRDGRILRRLALPGRGHDVTASADGRTLVAFARRPGTFAAAFHPNDREEPQVFACPVNRHFYGHGLFTPDGRLLLATENDYENGQGVLGIYDAQNGFARIGEWSTHGIGPHDLALTPDGATLIVANGGMDTHPDYGRQVLNLASMEPSIAFIHIADGSLIERHTLPADWSRLSTRHMDIGADGRIFVGCQWQGSAAECPPLLLSFAKGEERRVHQLPDDLQNTLQGYVGSVAVNRASDRVGITSPHGDIAIILDARSGKVLSTERQTDLCGIAPLAADFVSSTGTGRFGTHEQASQSPIAFDNHILALHDLASDAKFGAFSK